MGIQSNRNLKGSPYISWTKMDLQRSHQRLPFGSRKSPAIFNRITQAVRRIMSDKGIPCTAYLDDFFLSGKIFDTCQTALNTLLELLRPLGFRINWKKVVDPTQRIVFLGIQLDTVHSTMCLDPPKTGVM